MQWKIVYVQNDPIKCENSEEFQVEFVSEYLILLRLVEILRLIKFKLIFFLKISSKKILFHLVLYIRVLLLSYNLN